MPIQHTTQTTHNVDNHHLLHTEIGSKHRVFSQMTRASWLLFLYAKVLSFLSWFHCVD